MKKNLLSLIALSLTIVSSFSMINKKDNVTFEETTYLEDVRGIELNNIKRQNEVSTFDYSKIYVQTATTETHYYFRFATAVNGNLTSISYTRHVDGVEDKVLPVTTIYRGIKANDITQYYDGENLTTDTNYAGTYYWAAITIAFTLESTYIYSDFTVTLNINGQDIETRTESFHVINYHPTSLTKVEAVTETISTDGNIEHYQCNHASCAKLYLDAEGTTQTTASEVRIIRGKLLTFDDLNDQNKNLSGITNPEDGTFINDGTSQGTCFVFGKQTNGNDAVTEFDITPIWENAEWSSLTLHFCRWDANTECKITFYSNRFEIYKVYWDNDANGAVSTALDNDTFTFNANEKYHFKIIISGWKKTIFVNDTVVFSIDNGDYTGALLGIETWESTGYTITNLIYRDYYNDADTLRANYPEIWSENTVS